MLTTKIRTVSAEPAYHMNVSGKKTAAEKFFMVILFLCYLAGVIYFVWGERILNGDASRFHKVAASIPYWTQLKLHLQLTPFKTILRYWKHFTAWDRLGKRAFLNLAGNLILFLPMGIFLPYLFPKQRNFFRFSAVVLLMIMTVEVVQLFALLGACDIDDLILNYAGAVIGFLGFQILHFIRRKSHESKSSD